MRANSAGRDELFSFGRDLADIQVRQGQYTDLGGSVACSRWVALKCFWHSDNAAAAAIADRVVAAPPPAPLEDSPLVEELLHPTSPAA
eukprot:gene2313-7254_t